MLYYTKFNLNEAIDITKAKVDTKLLELEQKCTKIKPNQAISKLITKASNLELTINVQSLCQAKLGRATRNYPNWN